ncbi:ABC transporter permease [Tatumella morbirosei]|uniref:ABC transporter permease n=1 Tax=Tatumella morbirosei TaxID=642227 RepID=UPI00062A03F8|nr:ABC transporter permease [Tatumella morbirosei]
MTDRIGDDVAEQNSRSLPEQQKLRSFSLRSALRKCRGWVLPILGILLLEGVVRAGIIPDYVMPPPSELLFSFIDVAHGPLWDDITASLLRVIAGFVIGTSLAVVVGSLVGLSRNAEAYLDPTFQALRSVPSLAWVPLLLIWIGIDESSKVTLISIGAFFPMYLNLVAGIRNVDRKLVEVGTLYQYSRVRMVAKIILPAALPSVLTGLRSGLSMAWLCVVAAELLAATNGIGYMLTDGRETSRPDLVLVAIITLAVMGKISDSLLKLLELKALYWRDSFIGDAE